MTSGVVSDLTRTEALTYRNLCEEWNGTPPEMRLILLDRYRALAKRSKLTPFRAYAAMVRAITGKPATQLAALSVKGK